MTGRALYLSVPAQMYHLFLFLPYHSNGHLDSSLLNHDLVPSGCLLNTVLLHWMIHFVVLHHPEKA